MSKSQISLFLTQEKNSKEKQPVELFINDEELEQKDFAKYFRVYFDERLTWSEITNNKLH